MVNTVLSLQVMKSFGVICYYIEPENGMTIQDSLPFEMAETGRCYVFIRIPDISLPKSLVSLFVSFCYIGTAQHQSKRAVK